MKRETLLRRLFPFYFSATGCFSPVAFYNMLLPVKWKSFRQTPFPEFRVLVLPSVFVFAVEEGAIFLRRITGCFLKNPGEIGGGIYAYGQGNILDLFAGF